MYLRINPWITDSCSRFLNNLFKWYQVIEDHPTVFEWGGGNSSLYFLQNKCRVLTVESSIEYCENLLSISKQLGFNARIVTTAAEAENDFNRYDLTILNIESLADVGMVLFENIKWTFIVNDGISRKEVIDATMSKSTDSIVILDNVEFAANWGSLNLASAVPQRSLTFRKFLREPSWSNYMFEQPEGRDGHSGADATGWEYPHRWVSAVLWHKSHILSKLMITNLGFPIVNLEGLDDKDLETVEERCPYDHENQKWLVDKFENTLKLERNYD